MKVSINASTNGKGKHTEEQRPVIIERLEIGYSSLKYFPEDPFKGELKAYFQPHGFTSGSWNTEAMGLILGDRQWLKEFKAGLRELGLSIKAVQNVKYGEETMQGHDYVSLEAGDVFYKSWTRLLKRIEQESVDNTFLVNA